MLSLSKHNEQIKSFNELIVYLNKKIRNNQKIIITKTNDKDDGRNISVLNEGEIIKLIEESNLPWQKTKKRDSKDIFHKINNSDCNIKSSSFNSPDNVSSMKGIISVFSNGKTIKCEHNNYVRELIKLDKENLENIMYKDYFYLLYNKKKNKIFSSSLLNLKNLVQNGNNLPFQVKWEDNYYEELPLYESEEEYKKKYKECFKKCFEVIKNGYKQRREAYKLFEGYDNEK